MTDAHPGPGPASDDNTAPALTDQEFEQRSAEVTAALRAAQEYRAGLLTRDPADEITVEEAARALGATSEQVLAAMSAGRLAYRQAQGRPLITIAAFRQFESSELDRRRLAADAVAALSDELGLDE